VPANIIAHEVNYRGEGSKKKKKKKEKTKMADGHTANTRVEEAVTALYAIKDSKHRSFYALWKITKLFGGH